MFLNNDVFKISIHAAREGGDNGIPIDCTGVFGISIHAAREGGDLVGVIWRFFKCDFNPRRP